MSTSKSILIVCLVIVVPAGLARADCVPRTMNGKQYTCCTKSVSKSLGCDDKNAKAGDTLKCGNKTDTTRECTEVVEKKDDKKPDKKPDDKKSDKKDDKKSDKQADKKTDQKK